MLIQPRNASNSLLTSLYLVSRFSSHYTQYESELNCQNIELPFSLDHVLKFEKQNNISINVYGLEKGDVSHRGYKRFSAEASKMFPYYQEICDEGSSKQTYAFDGTTVIEMYHGQLMSSIQSSMAVFIYESLHTTIFKKKTAIIH